MPPTNPFNDYTDDQIASITGKAYAPSVAMAGAEDWFDSRNQMYGGDFDRMYDTVASKFLGEAGRTIVNADARRNFGRNLAAQKGMVPAKALASGNVGNYLGTNVDSIAKSGGFLRSGNVNEGLNPFMLKQALANGGAGDAATKAYGNTTAAYDSIRDAGNRIYGGAHADLWDQNAGKARENALGGDIHAFGDNPFYGQIGADPFTNALMNRYGPVIPTPGPSQGAAPGTAPLPPVIPGSPPQAGNGADDAMRAQWQSRRDVFQQTNGYPWEPWQDGYWQDQADRFGNEATNAKIANNSMTRARQYARAMGQPDMPPRITGPDDVAGMEATYNFLMQAPENHAELADKQNWMTNMQGIIRRFSPQAEVHAGVDGRVM